MMFECNYVFNLIREKQSWSNLHVFFICIFYQIEHKLNDIEKYVFGH